MQTQDDIDALRNREEFLETLALKQKHKQISINIPLNREEHPILGRNALVVMFWIEFAPYKKFDRVLMQTIANRSREMGKGPTSILEIKRLIRKLLKHGYIVFDENENLVKNYELIYENQGDMKIEKK
jgi:hypothetical protein